jgi:putative hemolysin
MANAPKKLIDTTEAFKDSPIKLALFSLIKPGIESLFGVTKLNEIHDACYGAANPADFCDCLYRQLNVSYSLDTADINRLREVKGPLVIVANHPFGGLEALLFIILCYRIRPDNYKIMANFMLGNIDDLRSSFIFVDPFGEENSRAYNTRPLKEAMGFLRAGGLLGVFPSGEVASLNVRTRRIEETEWNPNVSRLIQKTGASVVPLYFHGHNSPFWQLVSLINPKLRTTLLGREMAHPHMRRIEYRFGSVITPDKIKQHEEAQDLTAYLRSKVYVLKSHFRQSKLKTKIVKAPALPPKFAEIVAETDPAVVRRQIEQLPASAFLSAHKEFDVFVIQMHQAPDVLREVGRLREMTFRTVGEGTGHALDLDRFDEWYHHILVWNREKGDIVGSYRMGVVDEILPQRGQAGLYTNTLFHLQPQLFTEMTGAIELGRSFVRDDYQRSYYPLLLLWTGIGHFVLNNLRLHSLFGPVSISASFAGTSKDLMVRFLMDNRLDKRLRSLVKPRNPYPERQAMNLEFYNSFSIKSLSDVQDLMSEIETTDLKVPVLLKHYLRLGGNILAFNVDPDFNDVLDGLIHIDLRKTSPEILKKYMGNEGFERFANHHNLAGAKSA